MGWGGVGWGEGGGGGGEGGKSPLLSPPEINSGQGCTQNIDTEKKIFWGETFFFTYSLVLVLRCRALLFTPPPPLGITIN